jgi:hypothetical protein
MLHAGRSAGGAAPDAPYSYRNGQRAALRGRPEAEKPRRQRPHAWPGVFPSLLGRRVVNWARLATK